MDVAKSANLLYEWYLKNARSLPWRETKDPYKIWVSEIILQQTRVEQGIPYYHRFLQQFPSVADLAHASVEDVLLIWQGLGYYSRARNMHQAAQSVMTDFGGHFPSLYSELITLKGIGSYTAAAISSIASSEKKAVVDGNVIRWIARMWNINEPVNKKDTLLKIENLANELIQFHDSGIINQAMMEYGATVCSPQNPSCNDCIFDKICLAFKFHNQTAIPLKLPKKATQKRFFNYLFIPNKENEFVIYQRQKTDIWKGLYELPLVEKETLSSNDLEQMFGVSVQLLKSFSLKKHLLSHQQIWATVHIVSASFASQSIICEYFNGKIIPMSALRDFPISKLTQDVIMLISNLPIQ